MLLCGKFNIKAVTKTDEKSCFQRVGDGEIPIVRVLKFQSLPS